jgi:hypothetical protein
VNRGNETPSSINKSVLLLTTTAWAVGWEVLGHMVHSSLALDLTITMDAIAEIHENMINAALAPKNVRQSILELKTAAIISQSQTIGRTKPPFVPMAGKHQLSRNKPSASHNQSRSSV